MTGLELALAYPVAVTVPLVVAGTAPVAPPIQGGVVVDVPLEALPGGQVGLSVGARGWGASWEGTPSFGAQVWSLDVDLGYRVLGRPDPRVELWCGIGGGPRASLLAVDWWEDLLAVGLGASTGLGVVLGDGPVRGTLSARASFTLDFDTFTGTAMANRTTSWTYLPGESHVSLLAGVAFP